MKVNLFFDFTRRVSLEVEKDENAYLRHFSRIVAKVTHLSAPLRFFLRRESNDFC